ncbi:hypothetical protein PCANC_07636 [Puccinia coronata f. sp. avenae]|uniref:PWI domain-containing protein n=1 Tax=Puccinia coronata f. sp. avenae TaxID=200324 RepID=A0A2N5T2Q7_9BASI|nr:hypothetical protein PCANC_07636 [Puccinia coronata f. sp. avenae]
MPHSRVRVRVRVPLPAPAGCRTDTPTHRTLHSSNRTHSHSPDLAQFRAPLLVTVIAMYGNAAYPPYPPPSGQAPPVGIPPPPGSFQTPPTSTPFVPASSSQSPQQTPGFPSPQPGHPGGFGPPPSQPAPSAAQSSPPSSQPQQPPSAQPGIPPLVVPPGHIVPPFQHLPPPPGFPHLHPPPHLPPGILPQPHPHQFPHHPPPGSYFPLPNRHVGLGSHGQPHNITSILTPPANLPPGTNSTPTPPASTPSLPSKPAPTEIYSVFVGSIAEGVDDAWLERLLSCAGHLVSLRRIRDPNGKPKPFGFAEYGDPETVLRCLKVVDGCSLPIDGGRAGEKALLIKPDDKTKAKLNAYEANRIKTDQDTELDTQAVERLEGLISQMKDPDIVAATASDPNSSANNANKRAISKRGEAEKAAKERERSRRDSSAGSPAGPRGYNATNGKAGYGSSNNTPMGPRGTAPAAGGASGGGNDPQSSNNSRPLGFVRAGQMAATKPGALSTSGGDGTVPLTDEEEEKLREDRRKRINHLDFKDRERRWETRERNRAQTNQREQQREKSLKEEETRLRQQMKTRLANWDDDIEMDRGKELFYSNRYKWRSVRRTFRQREEKSDRIDEELENEQLEAIRKESEEFLNKQAEMIAKMQDENRKAGLLQLDEGGKPIQLSFGGFGAQANGTGKPGHPTSGTLQPISLKKEPKVAGGLLGNGDDDEDGFKKKRALIPLTYDDEDGSGGKQQQQQQQAAQEKGAAAKINIRFGKGHVTCKDSPGLSEEKRKMKMKEIVASVPTDKDALWKVEMKWEWLSESIINDKLKPFANKKIMDYLGLQEDELVVAIIDHIRAKKDAQGLVEELEPVLAEEAEEFTLKFWRMLVFELRAAEAGITSTLV